MKRDFVLVTVSMIIWGMGEGAFMYFQPLYLEELGASPLVIGAILGAVGLAMTLFHIPAGFLSDRIGRRQLMWAAWGMGVITTGIMAAARSLAGFSIGRLEEDHAPQVRISHLHRCRDRVVQRAARTGHTAARTRQLAVRRRRLRLAARHFGEHRLRGRRGGATLHCRPGHHPR